MNHPAAAAALTHCDVALEKNFPAVCSLRR